MIDPLLESMMGFLSPILDWAARTIGPIFTAAEWKAGLLILAVTLTLTHIAKVVWRLSPIKGPKTGHVVIAASVIALAVSPFLWPKMSPTPWWIMGAIIGPMSNVVFMGVFYVLNRFAPGLAAALQRDRRRTRRGHLAPEIGTRKEDR